ncbi:MAG: hypothetical protein ACFFDF_22575 [Candidatus Odinarchaeota archaeon]
MYEPEEIIYIVKVNRDHEYFKGRVFQFGTLTENGVKFTESIPYLDNQFNCDLCNAKIETDLINLIFIEKAFVCIMHGAYCKQCTLKYYKDAILKDIQFFENFLKKKRGLEQCK